MPSLERPLHILLAEDDQDLREILIEDLCAYNFKVTPAINGAHAIELLRSPLANDFDVILSDIQMPNADGFAVMQDVKLRGSTTPLVFLSSFADQDVVLKAIRGGVYEILEKPYDLLRLVNVISRAAIFGRLQRNHSELLKIFQDLKNPNALSEENFILIRQFEKEFSQIQKNKN
jgi:two-component system, OmpR family, response regulator VanR